RGGGRRRGLGPGGGRLGRGRGRRLDLGVLFLLAAGERRKQEGQQAKHGQVDEYLLHLSFSLVNGLNGIDESASGSYVWSPTLIKLITRLTPSVSRARRSVSAMLAMLAALAALTFA